jgi:hypothetical protein
VGSVVANIADAVNGAGSRAPSGTGRLCHPRGAAEWVPTPTKESCSLIGLTNFTGV